MTRNAVTEAHAHKVPRDASTEDAEAHNDAAREDMWCSDLQTAKQDRTWEFAGACNQYRRVAVGREHGWRP